MSVLQLLPINESAPADQSPYSALSAMAIDPQYISLGANVDFQRAGGEAGLDREDAARLAEARRSASVRYDLVRALKHRALRTAFDRFEDEEWRPGSRRAEDLGAYIERESSWLDEYGLFRALHARHGGQPWPLWDPALARREREALDAARGTLSREILFHQYVQWGADAQWQASRRAAKAIAVFGDLPFMVAADSADVWARQREFQLDASIGTPPDAFSETGQDWGLPAYRWPSHLAAHLAWLGQRARRSAALFDGLRIDHVVGFYRTYVIGQAGDRSFVPADEATQLAQGEAIVGMFTGSGVEITVEDLGTIPDFVRASLERLGAPGYRVIRWERAWIGDRLAFVDPARFPAASVATTGTHDVDPLAVWWEGLGPADRAAIGEIQTLREMAPDLPIEAAVFGDRLRDAFLELLYRAGSDLVLLPIQDVFGWRDRINVPATVTGDNWSYRLPWSLEALKTEPAALERQAFLSTLGRRSARGG
jgi:4-alpha-glucanotransferase